MKAGKSVCLGVLLTIVGSSATAEPTIIPDVVYGHKAGLAMTYNVVQPEQPNGAAVLVIVSASWISGLFSPEALAASNTHLLDAGFTVIGVNHGSAPLFKVPDAYADVSRAVRHVRLNAAKYGVDPDRLGVTGGSAGGHLSLMLGLDSDNGKADSDDPVEKTSNRVAAVVAKAPPTDLREWVQMSADALALNPELADDAHPIQIAQMALAFDPELSESVSPIVFVTPDDPPTLLIHGDADDQVDIGNSMNIAREFSDKGVLHDMITIEGGTHFFAGAILERANAAEVAWFREHLLD